MEQRSGVINPATSSSERTLIRSVYSWSLIFAWLAVTGTFCGSPAAGQSNNPATRLPAIQASQPQWNRLTFSVTGGSGDKAELRLSGDAIVSVYFNGQKLARQLDASSRTLVWDIGLLVRNGTNCLAVAATPQAEARVSVGIEANGKIQAGKWKSTTEPPPVGWQQSDFNDRDWQQLASVPDDSPQADGTPISWQTSRPRDRSSPFLRPVDGDHIVMLGATFIERAQKYGHLEAAILSQFPDIRLTFRNFGWSGDTVFAESRGGFDPPAQGYSRMIEHVRAEEPSIIFVCYGQNEAMRLPQSSESEESFRRQLATLCRDLSSTGATIVLVTPHPLLKMAAPLPDPSRWNENISRYAKAVQAVAAERNLLCVDLFSEFEEALAIAASDEPEGERITIRGDDHAELVAARNSQWTDNGVHWNDTGYRLVARILASRLLGRSQPEQQVVVSFGQEQVQASGGTAELSKTAETDNGTNEFEVTYTPAAIVSSPITALIRDAPDSRFNVSILSKDGRSAKMTRVGRQVYADPRQTEYEHLRQLIVRRNELYFHRWRPQNITYLYGFRKHEQGNNAVEIAQFDPLIAELESKIHEALQPSPVTIRVRLQSESQ